MKLHFISFLALILAPLLYAQQAPRVTYSPMAGAPQVPEETRKELVAWLADFQNTVFRMHIHNFLAAVNWREIVQGCITPDSPALTEDKMERLVKGMEVLCERMLPQIKPFFLYDRVEIRRIDLQGDGAILVGRCYDEDGVEFKSRWWLRRIDDDWRMTDCENATVAMRLSTLMAQALQMEPEAPGQMKEISVKFIKIGLAAENGNSEVALKLADELLALKLPGGIREMLLIIKADTHITLDETEEVDAALAELEKNGSTNPAYFLMRANRCRDDEKYEDCIVWTVKYGAAIGHDGDSWQMLADCHRELDHAPEFLQTARDWLADYPQSSDAMYAYWQALPEQERVVKLSPLLKGLPATLEGFDGFASSALLEDDAPALKLTIEVMKSLKMAKEDIEEWEDVLKELTPSEPEKGGKSSTPKPD